MQRRVKIKPINIPGLTRAQKAFAKLSPKSKRDIRNIQKKIIVQQKKLERRRKKKIKTPSIRIKTVVYTMTGKKYTGKVFLDKGEQLNFVDYADAHLVRFLIRDSGITENVRVLYFMNKVLRLEKRYTTTTGKTYTKKVWSDWISPGITGEGRQTIFQDNLGMIPGLTNLVGRPDADWFTSEAMTGATDREVVEAEIRNKMSKLQKFSRQKLWRQLKDLTAPAKPKIKYKTSTSQQIKAEIINIKVKQRGQSKRAKFNKDVKSMKIVIQPSSKLTPTQIEQKFLDSKTLKHCVFQPVINWAQDKIEVLKELKKSNSTIKKYNSFVKIATDYMSLYKDGASEDIIKKFCNRINVNFIIDDILTIDHKGANFITIKCDKKAIKTFKFINSRLNHIELNNLTLRDGGEQIKLEQELLNNKYIDLKKNNIDLTYNKINNNIQWISTINQTFQLDCETKKIFKLFYDYLDQEYKIKHNQSLIWKDELYSNLVQSSVHQCGRFLFKNNQLKINNFSRLDMRTAYMEFDKCEYYQGIPVQFSEYTYVKFDNTSRKNKIKFLKSHIGIYRISNVKYDNCSENTKRILDEMHIYNVDNHIELTSPELIFMIDNNIDFDIEYGCWTCKTSDWKFPEWMNKREIKQDGKIGPKWYSKIIGCWTAVRSTTDIYIDGCEKWANHIKALGYNVNFNSNPIKDRDIAKELDIFDDTATEDDIKNFLELKNEGSIKIEFDRKKSLVTHRCHFASFATSYQRIRLLQQLFKINYDDIYGVMTDEIVYKKHTLKKEDIMCGFIEKSKKYPDITSCSRFLSQDNIEVNEPYKDSILTVKSDSCMKYAMLTYQGLSNRMNIEYKNDSHLNIDKGPGGSCKSFWNLSYTGYIRPIYICPSHKLRDNKQKEFINAKTEVLYNMINYPKEEFYINGCEVMGIRPPCNIINDEATCNTMDEFNKLKKKYPFASKHMLGDFDDKIFSFQLMCIKYESFRYINDCDNDWNVIEYTSNKRAKCKKLRKLLIWYRKFMKDNYNEFNCESIEDAQSYREWTSTSIKKLFKKIKKKIRCISEEEIIEEYSINDYILVGTRNAKTKKGNRAKFWTDKMNKANKGNKYLMVKNDGTEKKKGRFNGSILIPSNNEENFVFKKKKCFEARHAFTCHQIQGETIKAPNKIFIDLHNFFSVFRMLYVALSRAEYLNQLYIISPK